MKLTCYYTVLRNDFYWMMYERHMYVNMCTHAYSERSASGVLTEHMTEMVFHEGASAEDKWHD